MTPQGEWLAKAFMANPNAASLVEAAEAMTDADGKELTHFSYSHRRAHRLCIGAAPCLGFQGCFAGPWRRS